MILQLLLKTALLAAGSESKYAVRGDKLLLLLSLDIANDKPGTVCRYEPEPSSTIANNRPAVTIIMRPFSSITRSSRGEPREEI